MLSFKKSILVFALVAVSLGRGEQLFRGLLDVTDACRHAMKLVRTKAQHHGMLSAQPRISKQG
jgi:hypothetical protein